MAQTKKQLQALCKKNKVKFKAGDSKEKLLKSLATTLEVEYDSNMSIADLEKEVLKAYENGKEPTPIAVSAPKPVISTPQLEVDPLVEALINYMDTNHNNLITEKQLMNMGVSGYSISMSNVNLRIGPYMITRIKKAYTYQVNKVPND